VLKTFSITDTGKKRRMNQDYVYSSERPIGPLPNLFLVADGMGGHNAGDYASRAAVETVVKTVAGSLETEPVRILDEAIQAANALIHDKSEESPELEGMGTTLVAASCHEGRLYVANVGDSRLYVANHSGMHQITRDHSWVEEMVRRGGLKRADARSHPDKNIITRAVGTEKAVKADFFVVQLEQNDEILMCTDGLTNMLDDDEIRMILEGARDIVEKAQNLVQAANEQGGRDNISVILIDPL